jgi:hypothetical protein
MGFQMGAPLRIVVLGDLRPQLQVPFYLVGDLDGARLALRGLRDVVELLGEELGNRNGQM